MFNNSYSSLQKKKDHLEKKIIIVIKEKKHFRVELKVIDFGSGIQQNKLKDIGLRTIIDDKPDKIGSKIRNAEIGKVPIMLILGEKEAKNNTVSIRRRFIGDEGELSIEKLIENVSLEVKKRSLPYRKSE